MTVIVSLFAPEQEYVSRKQAAIHGRNELGAAHDIQSREMKARQVGKKI